MPRRIASASDSFPENGIAAVLLVLPLYAPDTEIVGFMAFTLVVVLGTGASVATTPPLCPFRPESGSGVGRVLGGGGAANLRQAAHREYENRGGDAYEAGPAKLSK